MCLICRVFDEIGPRGLPTAAVASDALVNIEPAAVRQTADRLSMWAAAALVGAGDPLEANLPADLAPVVGVKSPHCRATDLPDGCAVSSATAGFRLRQ
jgi:hypothetical protein